MGFMSYHVWDTFFLVFSGAALGLFDRFNFDRFNFDRFNFDELSREVTEDRGVSL